MDMSSTPKQMDGERKEEKTLNFADKFDDQSPLMNSVNRDRLLFSVFSLLQKLGADERPEV